MAERKPHILIFNPDQWRGDALGHAGNAAASTPVLDRCVETDFVSFSNAYCQNPVCTPSRCSFMTGWYPHVRGHRTMLHMLHPERGEPNLLRILKGDGYFVWWGGKNDLVPGQDGYEQHCSKHFSATDADWQRWGHKPRPNLHGNANEWRGEPGSDTYYSFYAGQLDTGDDSIYGDYDWGTVLGALDFIRDYDGEKPLCIYLPLTYPHPPYGVEEPWFSLINRSQLPPRIPTPDDWSNKPSILKGIWETQNMQGWTEERWQELRATYLGMCARVDHQFGMVLEALREKEIYDDTAVFFFSDHGDFTGDYGLVEKTENTFEDCLTRVPFLVKPPQSTPAQPRVCDALVELVDFSETVYDLTGINPEYSRFGRSLLPLVSGETNEHRNAVFCEGGRLAGEEFSLIPQDQQRLYWPRGEQQNQLPQHTKAIMCRTRDYKYVQRLEEQDELYDLNADPAELNNRIADPSLAGVLTELKDRLLTHYLETCDVVPWEIDKRN